MPDYLERNIVVTVIPASHLIEIYLAVFDDESSALQKLIERDDLRPPSIAPIQFK